MQNGQLKVLHIISNLEIGGAQEVVRTLVEYLAEAGCMPVVCTFNDGPLRQEIERLGIPVEIVPDRQYSIVNFPQFVTELIRIRHTLSILVKKHNVDVVQAHLLRVLDFLVLTLKWGGQKAPLIFWTVHNTNEELQREQLPRYKWLLGPKRFAYRLLYRATARLVNGFIAVADGVKADLIKTLGPIGDKIIVIANGVDLKRYQRSVDKTTIRRELGLTTQDRVIAVVGAFRPQKGHRFLIEAVAQLVTEFPNLHVLLIGDGDLKADLQAQTRASGLEQHVHFLGSRADVPDLLAASDYFALPSLWEGLSMALIEAMASGLSIVATAVSGTLQVITPNETGLLVTPGDVQQLRDGIRQLLSNPALARALGASAQRSVENFSAKKQAEEHIDLYYREWNKSRSGHTELGASIG